MDELYNLYMLWLNDESEESWSNFVSYGIELMGRESFESHLKFFVQFGGAELYDILADANGNYLGL